jgi:hypothetical protein
LHTEGLAADVAFPAKELRPLWLKIRGLECCGAGYYQKNGFLHLDVGRARFWEPATSKVEENLSAGNARLFARTEFDRYGPGEPVVVLLHALTAPPVLVANEATLIDGDRGRPVKLAAATAERDGCVEVAERGVRLRVTGVPAVDRGRLVLRTCVPRVERRRRRSRRTDHRARERLAPTVRRARRSGSARRRAGRGRTGRSAGSVPPRRARRR